ncbi:hypothetical protein PNP85_15340 [Halobacterium salinarum]|uniref:Uncharacterized protein n=1 Tax=Halobacterium salinarum (strain ATCC 33171 / DSM 3754 / JCM 8978 / NBRC 102687 / NCIMB 764 / 91-R6) TaxID=2597657 RepID=A0A4D6GTM5_HALS9|nr:MULTISPECIES: hypothetical protein [Halobacterium]MDL0131109.1 hypothetical protein [Halobacterium salinarum]MDL0136939.1 hypothetical protein [Halobacterium salinarum]MDL0140868.1 hypothetical protein [Halobacterium salinarum]MDL0144856.1 hypothetical protein [Halobacterium salinarum]QCC45073.1 uncharacterized protein HBSAL_07105 [Halobacterium salinarum]
MNRDKLLKLGLVIVLFLAVSIFIEIGMIGFLNTDTAGKGGPTIFGGGTGHYTENIPEFGTYTVTIIGNGTSVNSSYVVSAKVNSTDTRSRYNIQTFGKQYEIYYDGNDSYLNGPDSDRNVSMFDGDIVTANPAGISSYLPSEVQYDYIGPGSISGTSVSLFETTDPPNPGRSIEIYDYSSRDKLVYNSSEIEQSSFKVYVAKGDIVRRIELNITLTNGEYIENTITFSDLGTSNASKPYWLSQDNLTSFRDLTGSTERSCLVKGEK